MNVLRILVIISAVPLSVFSKLPAIPNCSSGKSVAPVLDVEVKNLRGVKIGKKLNITCAACGNVGTFWFKDNNRFGETHRIHWIPARRIKTNSRIVMGKLNFRYLKKEDSGIYTCYTSGFIKNTVRRGDIQIHVIS